MEAQPGHANRVKIQRGDCGVRQYMEFILRFTMEEECYNLLNLKWLRHLEQMIKNMSSKASIHSHTPHCCVNRWSLWRLTHLGPSPASYEATQKINSKRKFHYSTTQHQPMKADDDDDPLTLSPWRSLPRSVWVCPRSPESLRVWFGEPRCERRWWIWCLACSVDGEKMVRGERSTCSGGVFTSIWGCMQNH